MSNTVNEICVRSYEERQGLGGSGWHTEILCFFRHFVFFFSPARIDLHKKTNEKHRKNTLRPKGEIRTINDRNVCERRSCMKNNVEIRDAKNVDRCRWRPTRVWSYLSQLWPCEWFLLDWKHVDLCRRRPACSTAVIPSTDLCPQEMITFFENECRSSEYVVRVRVVLPDRLKSLRSWCRTEDRRAWLDRRANLTSLTQVCVCVCGGGGGGGCGALLRVMRPLLALPYAVVYNR